MTRVPGPATSPPSVPELPDFPEPTYVEINGQSMAYVDAGPPDGAAVILVHGNPTWGYLWHSLLGPLTEAGFRAFAADHIGMGRSARPSPADYPYTLSRRISDFGRFVDTVAPGRAVSLVVHDWGGPIALAWAAENADRVDRLVLLNTGAFPLPAGKSLPLSLRLARLRPVGPALVRRANAFVRGALRFGVTRRLPSDVRAAYAAPYAAPGSREAVVRFVQDIPLSPADPAHAPLRRLEESLHLLDAKPALALWGMRDPVFDERVLQHLEKRMPHLRTVRVAEAGHYVSEDAEPVLAELIPAFLGEGGSAPKGAAGAGETAASGGEPGTIDLRDKQDRTTR